MNETVLNKLEGRLGRLHARQRLGIETDHEAQIFGQGINFFHIENWYSIHSVIRMTLRLLGLYGRGRRMGEQIRITRDPDRAAERSQPISMASRYFISAIYTPILAQLRCGA